MASAWEITGPMLSTMVMVREKEAVSPGTRVTNSKAPGSLSGSQDLLMSLSS